MHLAIAGVAAFILLCIGYYLSERRRKRLTIELVKEITQEYFDRRCLGQPADKAQMAIRLRWKVAMLPFTEQWMYVARGYSVPVELAELCQIIYQASCNRGFTQSLTAAHTTQDKRRQISLAYVVTEEIGTCTLVARATDDSLNIAPMMELLKEWDTAKEIFDGIPELHN